jgi:folylpolyglutamate synthase/dihydropteroate synthase
VIVAPDPAEALGLARTLAREEDTILVTGSLYTVAAVLRILQPVT